ncbi:MAG: hypothetical protein ACTSVI_00200 [Promethearchaeota archaeon]
MEKFPIKEFQELFVDIFKESRLNDLFKTMCDIIQGNRDPMQLARKLKLRFFEFEASSADDDNDDVFGIDDWLINIGFFITILKITILTRDPVDAGEIKRLVNWFHENMEKSRQDLLDDEIHYYYSLVFLSEFMIYFAMDEISSSDLMELKNFMDKYLDEIFLLPEFARVNACSTIVPYIIDFIKIHPSISSFLLDYLDSILDMIEGNRVQRDETLGVCIRNLSFQDYNTPISSEVFDWVQDKIKIIEDPFIALTAKVNLAVGHSLKNEDEKAENILAKAIFSNYNLPLAKKGINISFIFRGIIEARLTKWQIFKDTNELVKEFISIVMDTISSISEELESDEIEPDDDVDNLLDTIDISFFILSSVIDNLGLAAIHVQDISYLKKGDEILLEVRELNLMLKFLSRYMVYYAKVDSKEGLITAANNAETIIDLLKQEVGSMNDDELINFFMEFSRDCIEVSFITSDKKYLEFLNRAFHVIVENKELSDIDKESLLYEILTGLHGLVGAMWDAHFKNTCLIQGLSFGIE